MFLLSAPGSDTSMIRRRSVTPGTGPHGGVLVRERRLQALRSSRELAHCSSSQLRGLVQYVDEVAVPAGSRIATEGQVCNQFLIVIEGRLRVAAPGHRCHTMGPGDSWGWNAMWDRSANDATVVAESDARLLVMGHAQFRAAKAIANPL